MSGIPTWFWHLFTISPVRNYKTDWGDGSARIPRKQLKIRDSANLRINFGQPMQPTNTMTSKSAPPRKTKKAVPIPRTASKAFGSFNGAYYVGDCKTILRSKSFSCLKGKVQLILTSPPYPLNKKKSYGNLKGLEYVNWIRSLAPLFAELLAKNGSLIVELGNSWEPGRPVQSLLAIQALLSLATAEGTDLRLIQQFVCYNPSRLPSPAAWATIEPIRTVDSFTHIWWLAKSDRPKADNRRVLRPYSEAMKALLKRGSYNSGKRPSEHSLSKDGFLKDRGGSIPHNFIEIEQLQVDRKVRLPNAFSLSNASSKDFFQSECKRQGITPHPARMPLGLAAFFVEYLTTKGDLVLDPFAGSNTTGLASALRHRKWIAIEAQREYVKQAKIRFLDPKLKNIKRRGKK